VFLHIALYLLVKLVNVYNLDFMKNIKSMLSNYFPNHKHAVILQILYKNMKQTQM